METRDVQNDDVFRWMLNRDWTVSDLERAEEVLSRLRADESLRTVAEEYDAVRAALGSETGEGAAPAGGYEAFMNRMTRGMHTAEHRPTHWRFPGAPLIAAAAVFGAGFLLWPALQWYAPAGPESTGAVSFAAPVSRGSSASLLPTDIEEKAVVFRELTSVFEGQAEWVSFSGGRSDIGVSSALEARPAAADPLFVFRLTLERDGAMVNQTDVAVRAGQAADVSLTLDRGQRLRYRIATSPKVPTQLSLLSELIDAQGRGEPLAAIVTNLLVGNGQIQTAGRIASDEGEFTLTVGFRTAS